MLFTLVKFRRGSRMISVETRPPVDLSTFVTWLMHDAVLYDTLRCNELYAAGCFGVRKFETFPAMHCRTHLRRTRLEVARRILGDGSRVELIRFPENDGTLVNAWQQSHQWQQYDITNSPSSLRAHLHGHLSDSVWLWAHESLCEVFRPVWPMPRTAMLRSLLGVRHWGHRDISTCSWNR